MAKTTGAILDRVGACDMRYETSVIMPSLSSPNSFQPNQPSSLGAGGPGADAVATDAPPRRLLDQVRERVRYLHYSIRTEVAYVHWVCAFVRFHGLQHPKGIWAGSGCRRFYHGCRSSAMCRPLLSFFRRGAKPDLAFPIIALTSSTTRHPSIPIRNHQWLLGDGRFPAVRIPMIQALSLIAAGLKA